MPLEDIQKEASLIEETDGDEVEDALEIAEQALEVLSSHVPNNITISLSDEVASEPEATIVKKQRGRPNKHPFAGRINLLKSEINLALTDREAFKTLMSENHSLSQERYDNLVAAEQLVPVDNMTFVFKGKIDNVLDAMQDCLDTYKEYQCEKRIHKERIVTDKNNTHFISPTFSLDADGKKVYLQQDCFPDRIYGYVTVWFKKTEA